MKEDIKSESIQEIEELMKSIDSKVHLFCKKAKVTSIPKKRRFRDVKKGIKKVVHDEDVLQEIQELAKEIDEDVESFCAIANKRGKVISQRWVAIKKAGNISTDKELT